MKIWEEQRKIQKEGVRKQRGRRENIEKSVSLFLQLKETICI